jgi:[protein-PII] uridylyltransferase
MGQGYGPDISRKGFELCRALSGRTDRTLKALSNRIPKSRTSPWCLVATGGYGRRELCPGSDVDIVVLVDEGASTSGIEQILEHVIYPLWDRRFTLGYSIRTAGELSTEAGLDFFLCTSLLDARLLAGDRRLFEDALEPLGRNCPNEFVRDFMARLMDQMNKRHAVYAHPPRLMEPDIKEGPGGLRDYHCVRWALKILPHLQGGPAGGVRLTKGERSRILKAAGNLLFIRHGLHEATGLKADRMSADHLQALERMPARGRSGDVPAAGDLMRTFHVSTNEMLASASSFLARAALEMGLEGGSSLGPPAPAPMRGRQRLRPDKAASLLEPFEELSKTGSPLTFSAKERIERSLERVSKECASGRAFSVFMRILTGARSGEALATMLETGVLERIIPQFSALKGLHQAERIHTSSVDIHSITTVSMLNSLERKEKEIFGMVDDKECLYLAALLHDMGKGYGSPHTETGPPVAKEAAFNLGMDETRAKRVAFLVRHHLLLPDTALRRDLSEEKTILETARTVSGKAELAMLYLLCTADSQAASPLAWDGWKESLLKELFCKTLHALDTGAYRDPRLMATLDRRWADLLKQTGSGKTKDPHGPLWALPQSYVIRTPTRRIRRHLRIASNTKASSDLGMDVMAEGGHATVALVARDRTGLFATFTGILAMHHLEILSAEAFTWYDSTAVDTFRVRLPWTGYSEWDLIRKSFRKVSDGILDISDRLARINPVDPCIPITESLGIQVRVDNTTSDFFTLLEVYCDAHPDTVHRIPASVSALGLNIHRAFLTRRGHRRMDVYYVVNESGEKVTWDEDVKRLRRAVEEAARRVHPAGP